MKPKYLILFLFTASNALAQVKFRAVDEQVQTAYQETDTIRLVFGVLPVPDSIKAKPRFSIAQGYEVGMELTANGAFSWQAGYDFVNKNEKSKVKEVLFRVALGQWGSDTLRVPLRVIHTNRRPTVPQTPAVVWLFLPNQAVTHQFPNNVFKDEDGDEIAFRLLDSPLSGVTLGQDGLLRCSLSSAELKTLPTSIEFEVFETSGSSKLSSKGSVILKKSNTNYAPVVRILPNARKFSVQEDEKIEFRVEAKDANGDSIKVTAYSDIPGSFAAQKYLERINTNEYVLRWSPDLYFVPFDQPNREFALTFEARDSQDSATKVEVTINVLNKENWVEIDSLRSGEYRQMMALATDIFEQLEGKLTQTSAELLKKLKKKKFKEALGSTFSMLSKSPLLRDALVRGISQKDEKLGNTIKEFANQPQDFQQMYQQPAATPEEIEIAEFNANIQGILTNLQELQKAGDLFALHFKSSQDRRKKEAFVRERDALFSMANDILFQKKLQVNKQPVEDDRIGQRFSMYPIK